VSNMIISGGVNIYPREIEDILVGHPDIADAAVIGVPHPDMGESVRAIVEPAGPVDDEDIFAGELIDYCRERLSRFKCPTTVALVGTLPRLQTGKIAKRLFDDWLRQPYPDGVVVESDLAD
jgi:long-chain acyl-CoA synthetase